MSIAGLSRALLALTFLCAVAAAPPAQAAGDEHVEEERGITWSIGDSLHLTFTLEAGFAAASATNTGFGIGSRSLADDGPRFGTRRWTEGFLKPGLGFEYHLGEESSTLYGFASVVGAATRGDGDPGLESGTADRPSKLAIEDLYAGWKSGFTFEALGDNALDLSYGRQSFIVGDGFIIAEGTESGNRRAAALLGPRSAFRQAGLFRINTAPVRGDLFHLRSNVNQDLMREDENADAKLWGANVEWFESKHKDHGRFEYETRKRYLGGMFVKVYDADSNPARGFSFADGGDGSHGSANRDGLEIYSLRVGGALIPAFENFELFGEFALQRNNEANRRVRANAWYLEPQYRFADLPWSPRIAYRYAHFSGDGDPTDTTDKSWDQFFTAEGPRGFGTWIQGEIYKRWTGLGNSNLNAHRIHLSAEPIEEELEVGVAFYRFDFDKPGQTAGVTSKRIMDEINLYAEWKTPIKGLTLVPILGVGIPREGLRQMLGDADANNRRFWLAQIIAEFKF